MNTEESELVNQIQSILDPSSHKRIQEIDEARTKFVHYTTAQAGISIIQNRSVWLRNANLMNDFSEIQHGLRCLQNAWYNPDLGDRFRNAINKLSPELGDGIATEFNSIVEHLLKETYLVAISEHGNGDEDRFGRLSMWRAYGGDSGIALVFNTGPFLRPSNAFNAFSFRVHYEDEISFLGFFQELTESIEMNSEYLINLEIGLAKKLLEGVLQAIPLSTKHKGFHEEREWRVIHSPTLYSSENLETELVVLDGVPQRIYKIPFVDHPDKGFYGATIPELLDKIIIGPTAHPYPIWRAFRDLLWEAGVPDADTKVVVSDIPLRQ